MYKLTNYAVHEANRTLSNQIHRHKSVSGVILTTSKIFLNTEGVI